MSGTVQEILFGDIGNHKTHLRAKALWHWSQRNGFSPVSVSFASNKNWNIMLHDEGAAHVFADGEEDAHVSQTFSNTVHSYASLPLV